MDDTVENETTVETRRFEGRTALATGAPSGIGAAVVLARQLAVEYAPEVRVNALLPSPVLTPARDEIDADARALTVTATPAGRLGRPDGVAAVVAFPASGDASFITGASLLVDGGWSIAKASA